MSSNPFYRAIAEETCVLLIEDHSSLRTALREALEDEGFIVFSAASGEEALERAETISPQVAIVDIRLPDLSGWAVARRLNLVPTSSNTGIICMSSRPRPKYLPRECNAYLEKPFGLNELLATLWSFLNPIGIG